MKFNKWTVGLAAVGVVSLASAARADEQMSQVQTALTQTTLSGYVDTAMQWNPNTDQNQGTFNTDNGVQTANIPKYAFAKNDGFSLNAVDIALDKPEDSSAWAAGYRVEMMYGANAVGVPLTGVQDSFGDTVTSSATIRQAFVRLHTPIAGNGIDWQVGVFDSIIGYESNSGPLNPNYTRSYGYTIEPTTMTGILATYKVNDEISFSGGIANVDGGLGAITPGFTKTTIFEDNDTWIGSVSLTAPDSMGFLKGATLSSGVIYGIDGYTAPGNRGENAPAYSPPGSGSGRPLNLYVGATIPTPMNQLKLGTAFDYVNVPNGAAAVQNRTDNIWNIAGYATYQATDKMSVNLRAEVMRDMTNPDDILNLYGATGAGKYLHQYAEEVTVTLQYNLWANVITRGEVRWDHTDSDNFGASNGIATSGDPIRNNDVLLALNIVYQF
jgi:Putative beta-barrel porin-2, OmpL-like. bbp2